MSSQFPGYNPTGYFGTNFTNPGQNYFETRDPLSTDIHFPIGARWINTKANHFFVLGSVISNVANWIDCGNEPIPAVESLVLDDANIVYPIAGSIALMGNHTQGVSTFMPVAGTAEITIASATSTQNGVVSSSSVQHGVLIGGSAQSIINSTVAGVAGQILQSGGPSANPNWTSNINIAPDGIITTPNQSGMSAYQSADATNTTGDNTTYRVIFDTKNYDLQTEYNASTGVFTPSVAGLYLIDAMVMVSNLGSTHTSGNVQIVHNSSTVSVTQMNPYGNAASSNLLTMHASNILSCSPSDTLSIAIQITGGTKTVTVKGAANFTILQISKIA